MSDIALTDAMFGTRRIDWTPPFQRGPVAPVAFVLATTMAFAALAFTLTRRVTFEALPNPAIVIVASLAIERVAQRVRGSHIAEAARAGTFAVLFLSLASIGGVLGAYAGQRLGLPLQDAVLAKADRAMGVDWDAFTHWVDAHAAIAGALRAAYRTMAAQILAPALLLPFMKDARGLRVYLLAYVIALLLTDTGAALFPALSPIAHVDRASYHVLHFTGATPLDHLAQLRGAGPARIAGALGGIISFPSFHATVAVLTPLVLRRDGRALIVLAPLDTLMLAATMTEGAHYASDVLAGAVVAMLAYALAAKLA